MIIELKVHDDTRFVEIWLTKKEATDASLYGKLKTMFTLYASEKYHVVVYESGSRCLKEGMEALLRYNREHAAREKVP